MQRSCSVYKNSESDDDTTDVFNDYIFYRRANFLEIWAHSLQIRSKMRYPGNNVLNVANHHLKFWGRSR